MVPHCLKQELMYRIPNNPGRGWICKSRSRMDLQIPVAADLQPQLVERFSIVKPGRGGFAIRPLIYYKDL